MGKINNLIKIYRNKPNIIISHSRNFIRFPIKANIGIVTFLGIQITRYHIPSNLDARSNVDFPYHKPY